MCGLFLFAVLTYDKFPLYRYGTFRPLWKKMRYRLWCVHYCLSRYVNKPEKKGVSLQYGNAIIFFIRRTILTSVRNTKVPVVVFTVQPHECIRKSEKKLPFFAIWNDLTIFVVSFQPRYKQGKDKAQMVQRESPAKCARKSQSFGYASLQSGNTTTFLRTFIATHQVKKEIEREREEEVEVSSVTSSV